MINLFAKYPKPGQVKTRLGQDIGFDQSCAIYKAFVEDWITRLHNHSFSVVISPPETLVQFQEWLGIELNYQLQSDGDLGTRIHHCFLSSFDAGDPTPLIIGTDSPDLDLGLLDQAQILLKTYDVVLGPTYDGGYYLIGVRQSSYTNQILTDISWSTDQVLTQTLAQIESAQLTMALLPTWADIDTLSDLEKLRKTPHFDQLLPKTNEIVGAFLS